MSATFVVWKQTSGPCGDNHAPRSPPVTANIHRASPPAAQEAQRAKLHLKVGQCRELDCRHPDSATGLYDAGYAAEKGVLSADAADDLA